MGYAQEFVPAMTSPLRGLPPDERVIPALLERQAAVYGDRHLLRGPHGEERSFRDMYDSAARWGGMLRAAGVERGDRVAAMCDNRLDILDLVLGCAWIGAIAVPLNTAARGAQLQHMLGIAAPKFQMIESKYVGSLGFVSLPDSLRELWLVDELPADAEVPQGVPIRALPERGAPVEPADLGPGDTMLILYTSGTTGPSKGVCSPQWQRYFGGILQAELLGLGEDDVLFTCLPLFHMNPYQAFFAALASGARYEISGRFSASRYWSQVIEADATVVYLLSAMINILHRREPSEFDRAHRVRVSVCGYTPATIHQAFHERFGIAMWNGYGSTETNGIISTPVDVERPGYMGMLVPDFDVIIADENDHEVPDGVAGQLLARPREPFSMGNGYFNMPDATVAAWRNLWFHSGDLVVREEDGWYRFLDRMKDGIRRRGENISSTEVEEAIGSHPDVKVVAAFGVPAELSEEEVMVSVVPREGAHVDPLELVKHCEGRLAYYAIPRFIDLVDELPLTETGKVRKNLLRERGRSAETWDREAVGYEVSRV